MECSTNSIEHGTNGADQVTETLEVQEQHNHEWSGFRIVGDNVDKNIRPSFQRCDRQTKSLHYFHSFAVKDRVDFQTLSDATPINPPIDSSKLLPSSEDIAMFKSDAEVLVAR